ncbi:hypothetical protein [Salipiger sp.]|uniref:hypothetical protein n=1 Tax=Salipiger sp. TaxID=2078585 RepID=UPI003A979629
MITAAYFRGATVYIHSAELAGSSIRTTVAAYRSGDDGYLDAVDIANGAEGAEPVVPLVALAAPAGPFTTSAPLDLSGYPDGSTFYVRNANGDLYSATINYLDEDNGISFADPGTYNIAMTPPLPNTGWRLNVEVTA